MESSAAATTVSNTMLAGDFELAVLAMDRRRLEGAAEHIRRALATIDERRMHDYAVSSLVFAAAARLALHRGI